MPTVFFGVFCAVCALFALAGLALVVPRDIPPLYGTVALILTFAALGVAILR
ncbi:hypothetical protein [Streptomyces neyagawaensis]|uniref:hypothetical protein n=1 Tax=Streptomyces neyagawaensis TaxID=42238 RepID=UPI000B12957E|nr:hypothetical protein [Streptomyces neyagawaensis]MCL6734400.1 hypothetical protein [Streptomyces neyagawaensis]MDE1682029.1 hypothetical protein [Streptomyces neyagawaensis]